MSLTFEQAQEVHRVIFEDHRAVYPFVRRYAIDLLLQRVPDIEEIGSSDGSIAVTHALQGYEIPLVGPVVAAYAACGFDVPEHHNVIGY